jgi:hypothetical protein
MNPEARAGLESFVFGGCCAHKDLNAYKYGSVEMTKAWSSPDCPFPPPILLPNKANANTIRVTQQAVAESDSSELLDSAALRAAFEASTFGANKFASLLGALVNHKNDKQGYGDISRSL